MPTISSVRGFLDSTRRLITLSLLLSLLAGCATQPKTIPQTDWDSHQQSLQQLSQYQANGKLGYKGTQRFGANLLWRSAPQNDHLLLTNFLGKTLLKLDATPIRATLISHDGKTHQGTNASVLIQQLTDINLPVEQMRDWLIGLPTAADTYQLNSENRVAYLAKQIDNQLWQLDYNEYDYSVTPALPKRMVLTQGDVRITLVIYEWLINDNNRKLQ
ncbi:lipoprotein insertase outer membrane protein LolB [Photobacterium sp. SDRW27]|uniref:lipoprotein insertase outer membrane protein LolB n=1 Tax=Photobacterium obscurum TaxID=2829490 RepID=UPI00224313AC|nr:lipoprotein insertase outer membrane protein LolB [Photobacterium obscurum]MCW8332122.1 lipoprotein insertase outer membrane protein LolB [Photobacterium obscurum]